jgi:hypothetical protein
LKSLRRMALSKRRSEETPSAVMKMVRREEELPVPLRAAWLLLLLCWWSMVPGCRGVGGEVEGREGGEGGGCG